MGAQANFLESRLSAVMREAIMYDYPPLAMENVGFAPMPGDFEGYVPGATQFVVTFAEGTDPGYEASTASDMQTNETVIDMDFTEETIPVWNWFLTARYTLGEVDQAMASGRNVPSAKIAWAMQRGRHRHDNLAFLGNTFTKDSFARSDSVADHATLSTTIVATEDADEILDTLGTFISSVEVNSKGVFKANRLAVSTEVYTKLAGTYRTNTSQNLLSTLREAHSVSIDSINALIDVSSGRAVAYNDNPTVGKNLILIEPENLGVRDFKTYFEVPTRTQSAGFFWTKPLGARYLNGTG